MTDAPGRLSCASIPLSFGFQADPDSPAIRVAHHNTDQSWDIEIEVN